MNLDIVNKVMVLFLIMIIGYIASKIKIMNKEINQGLSNLLINITLPCMIITSFNFKFSKDIMIKSGVLLLYSIIIYTSLIFIGKYIYNKHPKNIAKVMEFVTIFSNCGFIGYPVAQSVYGNIGIMYASIFNIPFNILQWTYGVYIFNKSKEDKLYKTFLSPTVLSVFIGLLLFVTSIKLPSPIYSTIDMVGSITVPLSMLVVGSSLGDIDIKSVFIGKEIYIISAIRLIIVPLVLFAILKLTGAKDIYLGVPILINAMPASANTAIICEKYYPESSEFASKVTFVTTLLSILTIPLIMSLI